MPMTTAAAAAAAAAAPEARYDQSRPRVGWCACVRSHSNTNVLIHPARVGSQSESEADPEMAEAIRRSLAAAGGARAEPRRDPPGRAAPRWPFLLAGQPGRQKRPRAGGAGTAGRLASRRGADEEDELELDVTSDESDGQVRPDPPLLWPSCVCAVCVLCLRACDCAGVCACVYWHACLAAIPVAPCRRTTPCRLCVCVCCACVCVHACVSLCWCVCVCVVCVCVVCVVCVCVLANACQSTCLAVIPTTPCRRTTPSLK